MALQRGSVVRLMMGPAEVKAERHVKGVGLVLDIEYISGVFKGRRATVPKKLALPQSSEED